MKRKLRLVLVVLGMIATLEAKRTALRPDSGDDEVVVVQEYSETKVVASPSKSPKKHKEREHKEKRQHEDSSGKSHCRWFETTPAKEDRAKKLYADLALGFIKYTMPTITMNNAINQPCTVSLEHSSLLPMVRGGMGVEIMGMPCLFNKEKTTRARVGWQVLYAKKDAAIETIFTGSSVPVVNNNYQQPAQAPSVLLGLQDVERGEFMAVFSYDLLRDKFSIEGGLGVVGGALKDFELFQPPVTGSTVILPSYYTGQYLKAHKANFGGFIGANLCHRFKQAERVLLEVGYRCVFSSVKYHTTIYQNQPGLLATQPFQNGFSMAQTGGNAVLPAQPKFKVRAQQITFGIVAEF